jgi:hypothetical protein
VTVTDFCASVAKARLTQPGRWTLPVTMAPSEQEWPNVVGATALDSADPATKATADNASARTVRT